MFSTLTKGIYGAFDTLFGARKIKPYDIDKMIKTIKRLLVESDVSLSVVRYLIDKIKNKLNDQEIKNNLTSRDMVVAAIEEELTDLLSIYNDKRKLSHKGFIMICGLQGQGKTTSTAKIANYLKKHEKKVLLVSLDFYRPAAIDQLEILAKDIGVDFCMTNASESLQSNLNLISTKKDDYDVVLVDTAGRSHVDKDMMLELKKVYDHLQPKETLFVADAMQGQQGVEVARHFMREVLLTGVVLTKMDSDGSAGAVLSIQSEVKIPIKLVGTGEQVNRLEDFKVEKIVNRILDKGDVSEIIEKVKSISEEQESEEVMQNVKDGKITLNDYVSMIGMMKKMGGMKSLISMIPGMQTQFADMVSDDRLKEFEVHYYIISSMTKDEKSNLSLLNDSRKARIANGSGRTVQEVNKMIKNFKKLKGQIKQFKNIDLNNAASLGSMMSNFN